MPIKTLSKYFYLLLAGNIIFRLNQFLRRRHQGRSGKAIVLPAPKGLGRGKHGGRGNL